MKQKGRKTKSKEVFHWNWKIEAEDVQTWVLHHTNNPEPGKNLSSSIFIDAMSFQSSFRLEYFNTAYFNTIYIGLNIEQNNHCQVERYVKNVRAEDSQVPWYEKMMMIINGHNNDDDS